MTQPPVPKVVRPVVRAIWEQIVARAEPHGFQRYGWVLAKNASPGTVVGGVLYVSKPGLGGVCLLNVTLHVVYTSLGEHADPQGGDLDFEMRRLSELREERVPRWLAEPDDHEAAAEVGASMAAVFGDVAVPLLDRHRDVATSQATYEGEGQPLMALNLALRRGSAIDIDRLVPASVAKVDERSLRFGAGAATFLLSMVSDCNDVGYRLTDEQARLVAESLERLAGLDGTTADHADIEETRQLLADNTTL